MVYFVIIVPYKKLKERDTKVEESETELTVLTQIRDLLTENGASAGSGRHGATPAALEAEAAEARTSNS